MSARKRKEGESFKQYRANLKAEEAIAKLVKKNGKDAVLRGLKQRHAAYDEFWTGC